MANPLQILLLRQVLQYWVIYNEAMPKDRFVYHTSKNQFLNELHMLEVSELLIEEDGMYSITEAGRFKFRMVLTGGAYDLLHRGHIITLKEAKSYGDFLVVVVARDITVTKKKRKPVNPENDRMYLLNELKVVDAAVLGDEVDHMRIVRRLKPDIVAIGADQDHLEEILNEQIKDQGMTHTKIVRMKSDYEDLATTKLINIIKSQNY